MRVSLPSLPPLLSLAPSRTLPRPALRAIERSLRYPSSRSWSYSWRRSPVYPLEPSRSRSPACAGFTLVEVLVALFVVALGIAGAVALQTLAARAARDASHLSDGTRLARSLAERMRANPRALALPDDANPYLTLDVDAAAGAGAGAGTPGAATPCYADADCDADALARFDVAEVAATLATGFPGGRIRVCRDAVQTDAAGVPAWACDGAAGAPLVVKVGWRMHGETRTGAPLVVLPLAGAAP